MKGTVKWFNRKKGFGFIVGDDNQDYFVHYTALPKGAFLNENDSVTFDPKEGERGKQAQNVAVVGAETATKRKAVEDSGDESSEEKSEDNSDDEEKED